MDYKWTVLANTSMGGLMASINMTIVIISLPAIFDGLKVSALSSYGFVSLLWILMGYMIVTAALLVSFGRLSDMYGRKRFYSIGFVIFAITSLALSLVPSGSGYTGALAIIVLRLFQAVGGGFIMVSGVALLTDAFPDNQRGTALGINQVSFVAGSFLGLVVGGLLASIDWHLIFLVNVPVAVAGALWSIYRLKEEPTPHIAHIDLTGNITLSASLILVTLALTYALVPYGSSATGWSDPFVIGALASGIVLAALFVLVEARHREPMLNLKLFRIHLFSYGNMALLLNTMARGAIMFLTVIWLQGIYLPLNGIPIADTPFWAGIYMLPLTLGFVVTGPVSGYLTDKMGPKNGPRLFSTLGLVINAVGILLLISLKPYFGLVNFLAVLFVIGIGGGLFSAPNTKSVMDSLPMQERGAGNGVRVTFANIGTMISMALFFAITITAFSGTFPSVMKSDAIAAGLPAGISSQLASIPASSMLFSSLIGINPIDQYLSGYNSSALSGVNATTLAHVTSDMFIPHVIAQPFVVGLHIALYISVALLIIAAVISVLR